MNESRINVHYHTEEGTITDWFTFFVPHVGDLIMINNKNYYVVKVENMAFSYADNNVSSWQIQSYLEQFNLNNIE